MDGMRMSLKIKKIKYNEEKKNWKTQIKMWLTVPLVKPSNRAAEVKDKKIMGSGPA